MGKSQNFQCSSYRYPALVQDLRTWLQNQDFEVQKFTDESGRDVLQARKKGKWRVFVGMSTAANVALQHAGDSLTVEVGEGRWADKAVVGSVSMVVLWPLAVTAGFGAWAQAVFPGKVFDQISGYLS